MALAPYAKDKSDGITLLLVAHHSSVSANYYITLKQLPIKDNSLVTNKFIVFGRPSLNLCLT